MECIYISDLKINLSNIQIDSIDEINHLKALRIKDNELIMATNGRGISCEGYIKKIKNSILLEIKKYYEINLNENKTETSILLGLLSNKERLEFAIEKSVELGVNNIFLSSTKFSNKNKINLDRLNKKIISSLKQCKRTQLPNIFILNSIDEISKFAQFFNYIYIADIDGENLSEINLNIKPLIAVGPEGGFSKEEIIYLTNFISSKRISLGQRRLRSETALINILSLLNHYQK